MKVIFNITENKNKATFQQEVVKINTSFNQTQNIVKPKFQTGYYPLPGGGGGSSQKPIEVTKTELDILISENKLEPNRLYKITGVESWCFSKHLIKAIYLNQFSVSPPSAIGIQTPQIQTNTIVSNQSTIWDI